MNHYPHHIGDFAKRTKGLSLTERGAYRELLDQYYAQEGPLQDDKRELYRMAVAATPAERRAIDYVIAKYFPKGSDGLLHNKRADEELELYRKRKKAGLNGANSRWQNDSKSDGKPDGKTIANSMAEGCGSDSTSMPTRTSISDEVRSKSPTVTHSHAQGGHKDGLENQKLPSLTAWKIDDAACLAKAASVGIAPHPGEPWNALRARIMQAEAHQRRT